LTKVWITRASPGAEATAGRVRAMGWEPVITPLLQIRDLPAQVDLADVGALAFTSANGVRAFAHLSEERGLPVFAVGPATALAARDEGFATVVSADGDVAALAWTILGRKAQVGGWVLHPGAAELAGDLVGELERGGLMARHLPVYETVGAEVPPGFLARLDTIEAVLVHSPRAGRRLALLLHPDAGAHLSAYCISAETLATLEGVTLWRRVAAPLPNEDALLSLLADHRSPPRRAT
jgi:uroporphyrinogen-III synthase